MQERTLHPHTKKPGGKPERQNPITDLYSITPSDPHPSILLMFSAAIWDTIQQWSNPMLSTDALEAPTNHRHVIQLFFQLTTHAASIAIHQNAMQAEYNRLRGALVDAEEEDTITTADLTSLTEPVAEQRATIKALYLAARLATSEEGSALPILISDPASTPGLRRTNSPL